MPKQNATRATSAKRPGYRRNAAGARKKLARNVRLKPTGNPRGDSIPSRSEEARILVLEALPEIVEGLIKKAANGSYQQAKLLLDLFELPAGEPSGLNEEHKRQLCDALLEGWKLASPETKDPLALPGAELDKEEIAGS